MKKFFYALSLFGIFFIFSTPVLAACSWETELTTSTSAGPGMAPVVTVSGGCKAKSMIKDNENKCKGTKPVFSTNSGKASVCCCDDNTAANTDTPPIFKAPDFLVSIPGMKTLSTVNCKPGASGGFYCEIPWLGEYVVGLYSYALSIAGILAAIMLMAGGLIWLISAGDASKITQAKDLIIGSITGLVILAASFIILTQVNPDLVKMKSIGVNTVEDVEPLSLEGNQSNSTDCNNCVTLQSPIPSYNGKLVNTNLNQKLATAWANSNGVAWRVNEAYPPSSKHQSKCHYNGMCVDIGLSTDRSCTNVNKLIGILKSAGLKVLNEYTGCGGTKTTYSTGGHLHVQ